MADIWEEADNDSSASSDADSSNDNSDSDNNAVIFEPTAEQLAEAEARAAKDRAIREEAQRKLDEEKQKEKQELQDLFQKGEEERKAKKKKGVNVGDTRLVSALSATCVSEATQSVLDTLFILKTRPTWTPRLLPKSTRIRRRKKRKN